jgi:hypothetical protein
MEVSIKKLLGRRNLNEVHFELDNAQQEPYHSL